MNKTSMEAEHALTDSVDTNAGNLTHAQRYFAKVLGHLLADELASKATPAPLLGGQHRKSAEEKSIDT